MTSFLILYIGIFCLHLELIPIYIYRKEKHNENLGTKAICRECKAFIHDNEHVTRYFHKKNVLFKCTLYHTYCTHKKSYNTYSVCWSIWLLFFFFYYYHIYIHYTYMFERCRKKDQDIKALTIVFFFIAGIWKMQQFHSSCS